MKNTYKNQSIKKYLFFVKKSILAYQRSNLLGIMWTLLLPITNAVILIAVHTSIFHKPLNDSIFYIFPALFMWNYFTTTTSTLCTTLNASNVKTSATSNILFPLSKLFNFLPSFIAIIIFLFILKIIIYNTPPLIFLLNFFPAFLIFILFTLGIGLSLSALYVFFRDINHIWGVICQITFFICPILFPEDFLMKSKFWFLMQWNPMFYIIKIFRDPLLHNHFAPLKIWTWSIVFGVVATFIGITIFQKSSRKFIHFL